MRSVVLITVCYCFFLMLQIVFNFIGIKNTLVLLMVSKRDIMIVFFKYYRITALLMIDILEIGVRLKCEIFLIR